MADIPNASTRFILSTGFVIVAASYKNIGPYPYELHSLDKLESSPKQSTGKEIDVIPLPLKRFLPKRLKTDLRTLFCAAIFYLLILIS